MDKKLAVSLAVIIGMLLTLPEALAESATDNILVERFELAVGQEHQINGYPLQIKVDRIIERKDAAGNSYGFQLGYTLSGKSPMDKENIDYKGNLEYDPLKNYASAPNRGAGLQIAAESIDLTSAAFAITRDSDLIAKEHCNNGLFEAPDYISKTLGCSNCPDLIGDCSSDYANAEFPIKIKGITVENGSEEYNIANVRIDHTVNVRIKNEGAKAVTLNDAKKALFSYYLLNNVDYYATEFDKSILAPGEEYSFSYKYPVGFTFFPYDCGKETTAGLAYLHDLYAYGTYGGEAFAFNRVTVKCVSNGQEYPQKLQTGGTGQEETGIGYPGLSDAQDCSWGKACPQGQECFSFPKFGQRCAQPEPCSYFNCLKGTSCAVLESDPPMVACTCAGDCPAAEDGEATVAYDMATGTATVQPTLGHFTLRENTDNSTPENRQGSLGAYWTDSNRGVLETAKASANYRAGQLFTENSKLYMKMPDPAHNKQVNVMPEEAISRAESSVGVTKVSEVELRAESGKPVYVVRAKKSGKILSLIPAVVGLEISIDAENNAVVSVKKPWWGFLVKYDSNFNFHSG